MHVELNIVISAAVLAAGAGAFPAAEGLEAGPCTGRRALWTIGIRNACFDLVEEPIRFLERTVESRSESIVDVVGDRDGFIQIADLANGGDGQEHFMLPQAMRERQVGDESGLAEIAVVEHAAGLDITAGEECSASLADLFGEILEVVVGALIYNGSQICIPFGRVADDEFIGFILKFGNERIIHRFFDDDA